MSAKLNIAFVGLGPHAWENLLPALCNSPSFRLKVLCSRDEQKARAWADRFNVPHIETIWQQAVCADSIDAVFVSGPPQLHEEVILRCIAEQIPVFVEKPPAQSTVRLKQLIELSENAKLPTFVGYNFRFADAMLTAKKELSSPTFMSVELFANKPQTPLWGHGNVLKSFLLAVGIHGIEAIVDRFGEATSITSSTSVLGVGLYHVNVALAFTSGRSAVLNMGNYKQTFQSRFDYFAEGASVGVENLREIQRTSSVHNPKAMSVVQPSGLKGGFGLNGYGNELEAFANEIRGQAPAASPLRQSLAVYEIMNQILAQHAGEKHVVL